MIPSVRRAIAPPLFAFLFAAALQSGLLAQSFQGGVRGLVTDAGGAVVATAKITLVETQTNATRTTLTSASGEYSFSAVVPGSYLVTAESPGFKRVERKGITVSTQEFLTVDVKLEVGQVTESVNVTEEVPSIEVSNASTGQVIDNQKLVDLPNLGRNPFMMSKIAPNVVPVGNPNYNRMQDQSGSSNISIAGGPVRGNNYLIDGVPITDSVNRAVIIPTLESVGEVKVQANTYDAEMGRTGGGVFNTYMKSGTNQLHASAFGYMRQTEWLANTFFGNRSGLPRGAQPFRNYGASIGGPIIIPKLYNGKDRTFFQIGGEAYRMTSSYGTAFAVPTAREIAGDFSQTFNTNGTLRTIFDPNTGRLVDGQWVRDPFPGNVIPASRISPVGAAIARLYPAPNSPTTRYGAANLTTTASLYDRADQTTWKLDHQVTSFWRSSLSYLHYGSREPGENNFNTPSSPNQWLLARKVDTTQWNNILTVDPTTVLSVRYGFNRFPNVNSVRSLGYDLGSLGFSQQYLGQVYERMFPVVTMEGLQSLGTNNRNQIVYSSKNFLVSGTKFMGRHSLKAGYDFRRLRANGISIGRAAGAFTFDSQFTALRPGAAGSGADLASLLLGLPVTGVIDRGSQLGQFVNYNAWYVHDDFRVSSKLTLNLGLRWENESGLQALGNNLVVGFDRNAAYTLNGAPARGALVYAGTPGFPNESYNLNKNKFSPRLGAAYQLNSKTVLRGGYGVFWAPVPFDLQSVIGFTQDTPMVTSADNNRTPVTSLANPFPGGILLPVGKAAGVATGAGRSPSILNPDARSPIVHQYSFDIQREIGFGTTLVAGYVGSRANNLLLGSGSININQVDPQFFGRADLLSQVPNPYFTPGGVGILGNRTVSVAQSLKPFPQFDQVLMVNNNYNRSRYDSFVLKAQKRFSAGLSFISTWTFSRNLDASVAGQTNFFSNGVQGGIQNSYAPEREYSLSAFHTPHRWSNTFTYELPFGKGKRFLSGGRLLDLAVGGWSINTVNIFQTGFPLAITQTNNNGVVGGLAQRPNATGVNPVVDGSFAQRLDGWFNPLAFSAAPQFTFGNTSRVINLRGPGQANWDISLFKTFAVTERFRGQFRAEALNAFNTPMFRAPGTNFSAPGTFGKVTSQANFPRFIQLGVRFFF